MDALIIIFAVLSLIFVTVVFGWEVLALLVALALLLVFGPLIVIRVNRHYLMKQRRGE